MTTFLGFSKSKPEIFHGPDDIVVIIARQVSGREICVNQILKATLWEKMNRNECIPERYEFIPEGNECIPEWYEFILERNE